MLYVYKCIKYLIIVVYKIKYMININLQFIYVHTFVSLFYYDIYYTNI